MKLSKKAAGVKPAPAKPEKPEKPAVDRAGAAELFPVYVPALIYFRMEEAANLAGLAGANEVTLNFLQTFVATPDLALEFVVECAVDDFTDALRQKVKKQARKWKREEKGKWSLVDPVDQWPETKIAVTTAFTPEDHAKLVRTARRTGFTVDSWVEHAVSLAFSEDRETKKFHGETGPRHGIAVPEGALPVFLPEAMVIGFERLVAAAEIDPGPFGAVGHLIEALLESDLADSSKDAGTADHIHSIFPLPDEVRENLAKVARTGIYTPRNWQTGEPATLRVLRDVPAAAEPFDPIEHLPPVGRGELEMPGPVTVAAEMLAGQLNCSTAEILTIATHAGVAAMVAEFKEHGRMTLPLKLRVTADAEPTAPTAAPAVGSPEDRLPVFLPRWFVHLHEGLRQRFGSPYDLADYIMTMLDEDIDLTLKKSQPGEPRGMAQSAMEDAIYGVLPRTPIEDILEDARREKALADAKKGGSPA